VVMDFPKERKKVLVQPLFARKLETDFVFT